MITILKISQALEVKRLLSSFHEPMLKFLKQIYSMNEFAIVFNYMQRINYFRVYIYLVSLNEQFLCISQIVNHFNLLHWNFLPSSVSLYKITKYVDQTESHLNEMETCSVAPQTQHNACLS